MRPCLGARKGRHYSAGVVEGAVIPFAEANRVFVSRTYAYVAAGSEGLVIVDVEKPEEPKVFLRFDAEGTLDDTKDVAIATTNASLFAYVADGKNGLKNAVTSRFRR